MRSVLITGGTGTLGRALAARLLDSARIERVALYSRDEAKHALALGGLRNDPRLRPIIGDVRDRLRLEKAMRGVDTVIHAAAMKRIEACERDPEECEKTNVGGSRNVVEAALSSERVKRCLLISTDKAASPYTVYGASKMQAETAFLAANVYSGEGGPVFGAVRYGNVLGSRGSVVEMFRALRDQGCASLPITDRRMTRFWLTVDQAVNLVMTTLADLRPEIIVPKLPSAYITDIAAAVCPAMPTHVIGLRSYEKLHETLISEDQAATSVDRGDHFAILPHGAVQTASDVCWSYTSDSNDRWLSVGDIRQLLNLAEEVVA